MATKQAIAYLPVDPETFRRLKVYAAAYGVPLQKLGTEILLRWLNQQAPVGGPISRAERATKHLGGTVHDCSREEYLVS